MTLSVLGCMFYMFHYQILGNGIVMCDGIGMCLTRVLMLYIVYPKNDINCRVLHELSW
jgi:hypothetical protein